MKTEKYDNYTIRWTTFKYRIGVTIEIIPGSNDILISIGQFEVGKIIFVGPGWSHQYSDQQYDRIEHATKGMLEHLGLVKGKENDKR